MGRAGWGRNGFTKEKAARWVPTGNFLLEEAAGKRQLGPRTRMCKGTEVCKGL